MAKVKPQKPVFVLHKVIFDYSGPKPVMRLVGDWEPLRVDETVTPVPIR